MYCFNIGSVCGLTMPVISFSRCKGDITQAFSYGSPHPWITGVGVGARVCPLSFMVFNAYSIKLLAMASLHQYDSYSLWTLLDIGIAQIVRG